MHFIWHSDINLIYITFEAFDVAAVQFTDGVLVRGVMFWYWCWMYVVV
jgi:hypothetical protein